MNEVREVTGTAFVVAEFRARENTELHPLYLDAIVPIFLDDRTRRAADAISDGFPAAATNVRLRTRYFDDRLDDHLARGFQQVVILGAGLDTRAARKRVPGVVYFEIDDASLQCSVVSGWLAAFLALPVNNDRTRLHARRNDRVILGCLPDFGLHQD